MNWKETKRRKGKRGGEGAAGWKGELRKGGRIRLNERKHEAGRGESGRLEEPGAPRSESRELVVNGVLIQRR